MAERNEHVGRGNWSSKMDFILSCVGAISIGLSSVWRFPFLAYQNGGGAFLVPYAIILLLVGLPMLLMEVCMGQYSSQGPITVWRAIPMMRGSGYNMVIISFYVGIYYNVIIMYCLYYLFASFATTLPWIGCQNSWNTPTCSGLLTNCMKGGGIIADSGACLNTSLLNSTQMTYYNISKLKDGTFDLKNYKDPLQNQRRYQSEEYWRYEVLQESSSMNEPGGVIWQLALWLLLPWSIVFLCLIKGVKSYGKVVYVTVTTPYIILVIILIRGLTLPGYKEGISFFFTPTWHALLNPRVWLEAGVQVLHSFSISWGGLFTLGSYNKFHNNIFSDAIVIICMNIITCLMAGLIVFSVLGFMAHELNTPVSEVADLGFGLAFIAYPEAVSHLPLAQLWSVLFFLMLVFIGLNAQFSIIETVITAIVDHFPDQLRTKKPVVTFVVCCFGYLLGLPCVTHAGPYWVSLIDGYAVGFAVMVIAIFNSISINWIYGTKRFTNDIRAMIGKGLVDFAGFKGLPLLWSSITPALLIFVVTFNLMNWTDPSYNGPYPKWAQSIGWLIIASSIIWIPVIIVYEFVRSDGSAKTRWRTISRPHDRWGPALYENYKEALDAHINNGTTIGGTRAMPAT